MTFAPVRDGQQAHSAARDLQLSIYVLDPNKEELIPQSERQVL
jgi:hypothetical protein